MFQEQISDYKFLKQNAMKTLVPNKIPVTLHNEYFEDNLAKYHVNW